MFLLEHTGQNPNSGTSRSEHFDYGYRPDLNRVQAMMDRKYKVLKEYGPKGTYTSSLLFFLGHFF